LAQISLFNVSSQKEAAFKKKMVDLHIFEADLEEQFIHRMKYHFLDAVLLA